MSVSSTLYDTDRFGAALPASRPASRPADGVARSRTSRRTVLRKSTSRCASPSGIAFGVCRDQRGFYQNYAALPGIDKIIR